MQSLARLLEVVHYILFYFVYYLRLIIFLSLNCLRNNQQHKHLKFKLVFHYVQIWHKVQISRKFQNKPICFKLYEPSLQEMANCKEAICYSSRTLSYIFQQRLNLHYPNNIFLCLSVRLSDCLSAHIISPTYFFLDKNLETPTQKKVNGFGLILVS